MHFLKYIPCYRRTTEMNKMHSVRRRREIHRAAEKSGEPSPFHYVINSITIEARGFSLLFSYWTKNNRTVLFIRFLHKGSLFMLIYNNIDFVRAFMFVMDRKLCVYY